MTRLSELEEFENRIENWYKRNPQKVANIEKQFKNWCKQNPQHLDELVKKYILFPKKEPITLHDILGPMFLALSMFPPPPTEYTFNFIINNLYSYKIQVKDGPGYYV